VELKVKARLVHLLRAFSELMDTRLDSSGNPESLDHNLFVMITNAKNLIGVMVVIALQWHIYYAKPYVY